SRRMKAWRRGDSFGKSARRDPETVDSVRELDGCPCKRQGIADPSPAFRHDPLVTEYMAGLEGVARCAAQVSTGILRALLPAAGWRSSWRWAQPLPEARRKTRNR